MTLRLPALALALAAGLLACSPGIGDACKTNDDCGSDRSCDLSQPGGYCTVFSCERDGCPSDAVCVEYGNHVSYCMQRCGPFAFCREGYECVEDFPKADDSGNYPGFCNQVALPGDAIQPADATPDGSGTPPTVR